MQDMFYSLGVRRNVGLSHRLQWLSDDPAYPHPGGSATFPLNLKYRLGKLKAMGLQSVWLLPLCQRRLHRGVDR